MDFGNSKELRFFNHLRLNSNSQAFGRGGGGGGGRAYRYRLCDTLNEAKVPS